MLDRAEEPSSFMPRISILIIHTHTHTHTLRYDEAMYCLDRSLLHLLPPANVDGGCSSNGHGANAALLVRAQYSRAQVYSLVGR